jgi:hypothetical protein
VATKTPAKGKKPAKDGAVKKSAATKAAKAEASKPEPAKPAYQGGDDDEDADEAPVAPAKKPAPKPRSAAEGVDPPPVVPARRLTPEAKAQVNAMVQKGVPLGEALKMAASWETFVAPVKEEPAKLVQGKLGEPGGRPAFRREEEGEDSDRDEEEPAQESED